MESISFLNRKMCNLTFWIMINVSSNEKKKQKQTKG